MTDPRETLARIRAQADAASPGPWFDEERNLDAPWDLTTVYYGFHNGETPDRDLVAEAAYDNAEFIAASRTTVPALLDALEKVLERHAPMPIYVLAEDCEAPDDHQHGETPDGGDDLCWDEPTGEVLCCECRDEWGERVEHPCPDYTAITTALEGETP